MCLSVLPLSSSATFAYKETQQKLILCMYKKLAAMHHDPLR